MKYNKLIDAVGNILNTLEDNLSIPINEILDEKDLKVIETSESL